MANPLLKITDLNTFYGDAQALWDVGFQVHEGEVSSIIGSNGAGKSTILRTLSGLMHPSSGQIEFLGSRIDGKSPMEMVDIGISLVPEGRGLFSTLTVMENLELGAFTKRARLLTQGTMIILAACIAVPLIFNPETSYVVCFLFMAFICVTLSQAWF